MESDMCAKPVKTPPAASTEAGRDAKRDDSLAQELTKNRPGPVREGPDYLRQRAEWFRRRSGGEEKK
jgi:hypothetical protein